MKRIVLAWATVFADSTTAKFFPVTPWMDTSEIEEVRLLLEIAVLGTNLEISLGYQTCDVIDTAGTPTGIHSYQNTEDVHFPSSWADISAATNAKRLVRFGFLAKLSTGSTLALGRVSGSGNARKKA